MRIRIRIETTDSPVIAAVTGANKRARTRRFVALAEIGLQVTEPGKITCWQPSCAQLGLVSTKQEHDIRMTVLIREPLIQVLSQPSSLTNSERLVSLARIGLWQEQQWIGQLQSLPAQPSFVCDTREPKGKLAEQTSGNETASAAMKAMLRR
jgi:hypothetical protein